MQLRLPRRNGSQAFRLMENKRFRASYDFLLLREDAGELEPGLGAWWTHFQEMDEDQRLKMVSSLAEPLPTKKRRRRRPRRSPAAAQPDHD